MEHGEVIRRLLLAANEDATEAVHPGMRALDDPAARSGASVTLGADLLATPPEMQRKAELQSELARLLVIVALVQTKMLRRLSGGRRPLRHEALERLPHQLVIVPIGVVDDDGERRPAPVRQQ
jgi:hypothetical protein